MHKSLIIINSLIIITIITHTVSIKAKSFQKDFEIISIFHILYEKIVKKCKKILQKVI